MIFYKSCEEDDPLYSVYSSPQWLRDYDPVSPFPLIVDLELTNHCNLDCVFCQRRLSNAPKGCMSEAHWRLIVDECSIHGVPIRISGWGEPLIHKEVVRFIEYASEQNVLTKIYTNGLLLKPAVMDGLIAAGLGELQFSMQGLNAHQYGQNRRRGDYETLAANIRMAYERRALEGEGPFLSIVTSVLKRELEEGDAPSFAEEWLQFVDKVAIDMTNLHFVGNDEDVQPMLDQHLLESKHAPCVDIFLKIHIAWNGTLDICSQDAHHYPEYGLGRIGEMSIQEAWKSEHFECHRNLVGRSVQHDKFRLCRHCFTATHKYDHLKEDLAARVKNK